MSTLALIACCVEAKALKARDAQSASKQHKYNTKLELARRLLLQQRVCTLSKACTDRLLVAFLEADAFVEQRHAQSVKVIVVCV